MGPFYKIIKIDLIEQNNISWLIKCFLMAAHIYHTNEIVKDYTKRLKTETIKLYGVLIGYRLSIWEGSLLIDNELMRNANTYNFLKKFEKDIYPEICKWEDSVISAQESIDEGGQ